MNADPRPRKKPRLFGPPAGFTTTPKAVVKTSAPRFTSGFENGQQPVTPSKENMNHSPSSTSRKPTSRAHMKLPVDLLAGDAVIPKAPKNRPPVMQISKDAKDVSIRNTDSHEDRPIAKRPLAQLPPLPALPIPSRVFTPLKPLAPPPHAEGKPQPVLKLHTPPPPPLPPSATPARSLKTISNTAIARATDLSAEGGAAEIASIFLKDVLLPTAPSTPTRRHKLRGLELSPEKREKGDKSKFMRGKLAAHASAVLSQTQNSFSLWQTDIEHQLTSTRRPTPDLRLQIEEILHVPVFQNNSLSPPSSIPGIALCRILTKTSIPNLIASRLELHRTVFSFPLTNSNTITHNAQDFVEGKEVHIWDPWDQIRHPSTLVPEFDGDMAQKPAKEDEDEYDFSLSQPASGSDHDQELELVLAQHLKAVRDKQKKEKEKKFLAAAQKQLSQQVTAASEEKDACIQAMEEKFSEFLMKYAEHEDKIHNLWLQILEQQKTLTELAARKKQLNINAGQETEEGHISALSKIRGACQDYQDLIDEIPAHP
ncbi:hypothetical protein AX16_009298 [Volvariella volvacea WC 439]|nr:hypothetical protein AX16_009298 [Volvariella volvacea WC 439]